MGVPEGGRWGNGAVGTIGDRDGPVSFILRDWGQENMLVVGLGCIPAKAE